MWGGHSGPPNADTKNVTQKLFVIPNEGRNLLSRTPA
jgi:hypothetical protein